MGFHNKYFGIFITVINIFIIITTLYALNNRFHENVDENMRTLRGNVLGIIAKVISTPGPPPILSVLIAPSYTPTPSPIPSQTPIPTPIVYSVTLLNIPENIMEGELATFTWSVGGSQKTITTTSIYMGTESTPDLLGKKSAPQDSKYTQKITDFLDGQYKIPLNFVGNIKLQTSGTYFARAYALIDGRHIWSEEYSFAVKSIPRNDILIVNYPKNSSVGQPGVFTWDIAGPSGSTTYTTIVIGRQSKPGKLDADVDIAHTPYLVLVKDFTSGVYNIPLRFVGNTIMQEAGTYYIRAYAWINGKNVWSDEHEMKVE